jgi:hypothetical protein
VREVLAGFSVSLAVVGAVSWLVASGIARPWPLISMPILSLALPLAMPTGRWLLGCAASFLLAATGLFCFHLYQVSNTTLRGGGAGEAIGLAIFASIVTIFVVGALSKAIYFRVRARRLARIYASVAPNKSFERTHEDKVPSSYTGARAAQLKR